MIYKVDYFMNLLKKKKLVLICDLDETLISSISLQSKQSKSDYDSMDCDYFSFPYGNKMHHYCMKKRPYLDSFLSRMSEIFELHLMSAGMHTYVRKCVDIIDPKHKYFRDRIISREDIVNKCNKAQTKLQVFSDGSK